MMDDILMLQNCSNTILRLNRAINTFIDLEKLTLSKNERHLGKQNKNCPALKVHGDIMEQSDQEKYLGDIVHKSGKGRPNIEARKGKGVIYWP